MVTGAAGTALNEIRRARGVTPPPRPPPPLTPTATPSSSPLSHPCGPALPGMTGTPSSHTKKKPPATRAQRSAARLCAMARRGGRCRPRRPPAPAAPGAPWRGSRRLHRATGWAPHHRHRRHWHGRRCGRWVCHARRSPPPAAARCRRRPLCVDHRRLRGCPAYRRRGGGAKGVLFGGWRPPSLLRRPVPRDGSVQTGGRGCRQQGEGRRRRVDREEWKGGAGKSMRRGGRVKEAGGCGEGGERVG